MDILQVYKHNTILETAETLVTNGDRKIHQRNTYIVEPRYSYANSTCN